MVLIFKAQDAEHVEKQEIYPHQEIPEGFYTSREEALENWKKPAKKSGKE